MTAPEPPARPRRRGWLWVAGGSALLFAAGGFLVGSGAVELSTGVVGAQDAPADDAATVWNDSWVAEAGYSTIVPIPEGDDDRVVLTGSGFGTDTASAVVYEMDVAGATASAVRAQVAEYFGMTGEFHEVDGGWRLEGPLPEGSNQVLDIGVDGTFTYVDDAAALEFSGEIPGAENASTALHELIVAIGWDPGQFALALPEVAGYDVARSAIATLVLDGHATDVTVQIKLTTDGIFSASGQLAQPYANGEYPVVSETQALARTEDPDFGLLVTYPQGYDWDGNPRYFDPGPLAGTPAPVPDADAPIPWPVTTRELVSVEHGWMHLTQSDGAVLIVPSYVFSTADGITYEVVALADDALTLSGS